MLRDGDDDVGDDDDDDDGDNDNDLTLFVILEKQNLSTLVIPRARNMDGTTPMLPRRSGWQISDNVK